ncbi:FIMAH domain-containing protein [Paenibacillus sp. GXUN7292]|uniref:FIMAH domain-containing protein n=1 Tax=Paenibacillus sp. GXUN7292 TaxID=3422499 RepID=UPI003D7E9A9B
MLAGGYLNFHDGYLYGEAVSRIFRLDPVTWEHTILSKGHYFAQDEYGRVFTGRNSMDLYMYDDIAPIFAADASLQYEWTEDGGLVLEWPVNADMKKFQITRDGVDVTANGELSREGGNGTAKFNMAADFAEPGAYEVTAIDYAGNESEEALSVIVNEQPDDVTLEGLNEQLKAYISSGDVRGPLVNQLSNSLRQAQHHYSAGRTAQATKQLEDFLKRMNNPPMGRHIEADAKQTLEHAVHELLVQWHHADTD